MSRIFIIGGTGGVGSKLGPLLVAAGHQVTSLHRKPEQASDLAARGVTPYLGDIMEMTSDDFVNATKNIDVIVFSAGAAGSGVERTSAIDGEGVTKAIQAAKINKISRFYLVSAFMDAGRGMSLGNKFEHYMKVKREADNAMAASGLEWVILRPGGLTDRDGDGLINANLAIPSGYVARENVAATLAALIETPEISREIIELTDGDVPVHDALMSLRR